MMAHLELSPRKTGSISTKGNDFELDSEAYPDAYYHFRYLRVVLTSYVAWEMPDAANAAAQFGELSLYGRVTKTEN